MAKPPHMYQIFIKAPAERVWQALTDPEFTQEYFHAQRFESSLEGGRRTAWWARPAADVGRGHDRGDRPAAAAGDDVADALRRGDERGAAEPGRVGADDHGDGVTKVVTIHRDLGRSPLTSASVGDGWIWVLGSLKSFVETGAGLPGWRGRRQPPAADASVEQAAAADHRRHGIEANNSTWELLDGRELTPDEVDDLLGRAYAAAYHWRRASGQRAGERGPGFVAGVARARRARPRRARPAPRRPVRRGGGRGGARRLRPRLRPRGAGAGAGLPRPSRRGRHRAGSRLGGPHRRRGGRQDPRGDLTSEPWFGLPVPPPPPQTPDFHKQNRARALDFAYLNQRWALSLIPVREIVQECTKMLVEIFALRGRGGRGQMRSK